MKADEVAQLYVHGGNASIKVPINELKRFQRITLAAGEIRTLSQRQVPNGQGKQNTSAICLL